MKIVKWILIVGVIGFVLIQFIPYGHNHENPAVIAEPNWDSPTTQAIAEKACYDCHSNKTVWPWYSNIAPVSWLVMHDVEEGRQHLNFSDWENTRNKQDIVEVVQEGEMPPGQYLLMHAEAKLTQAEIDAFIQGIRATINN